MGVVGHILSTFKYSLGFPYERNGLKILMESLSKDELEFLRRYFLTYISKEKEYYWDSEIETFESWQRKNDVLELLKLVIELLNPTENKRKKNKSIGYLLKEFSQNKEVRNELKLRFDFQAFNVQRKIILAFLNSDRDDREWAYLKLLDSWDNFFLADIKRLWELYHEEFCGRLVINHLCEEYIVEQQEKLDIGKNYRYLALRLYNHSCFTIKEEKFKYNPDLNEYDYIYVIANTGGVIKGNRMLVMLFQLIAKEVNNIFHNYNTICKNIDYYSEEDTYVSTKLIPKVDLMIECMGKMGLHEELIFYMNWDIEIRNKFKEYWDLYIRFEEGPDTIKAMWNMFCEIAEENFPKEFMYLLKSEDN